MVNFYGFHVGQYTITYIPVPWNPMEMFFEGFFNHFIGRKFVPNMSFQKGTKLMSVMHHT